MDFLHETLKGSLQEGEYVATISSYKETTRYGKRYLEVILDTKDGSIACYLGKFRNQDYTVFGK